MGGAERARAAGHARTSAGSDSAKSVKELLRNCPGRCPSGHMLFSVLAKHGNCDGCGKMVLRGEYVMNCDECNWYLCDMCLPQERNFSSPLWGVLSYVVDSATQEITDLAAGIQDLVPRVSCAGTDAGSLQSEEIKVGRTPIVREAPAGWAQEGGGLARVASIEQTAATKEATLLHQPQHQQRQQQTAVAAVVDLLEFPEDAATTTADREGLQPAAKETVSKDAAALSSLAPPPAPTTTTPAALAASEPLLDFDASQDVATNPVSVPFATRFMSEDQFGDFVAAGPAGMQPLPPVAVAT